MNRTITKTFSTLRNALNRFEAEVAATLADYRRQLAVAKERSQAYKDERGEFERARQGLISPARSRIAAADATLADAVKDGIAELHSALAQHVTEQPDPAFVSLLHNYQEFGVNLDRVELEALALQGAGNFVSLRLLSSLAAQSGFKLTAPTAADFERDIKALEMLTVPPLMLCPAEYATEAADVMEDVPYRRADQSVAYQSGRPSPTYMTVRASHLKRLQTGLAAASDRWGTHFVPTLEELEQLKNANGQTVTPVEQRAEAVRQAAEGVEVDDCTAEDLAQALAARNEAAEQAAAKTCEEYMGKRGMPARRRPRHRATTRWGSLPVVCAVSRAREIFHQRLGIAGLFKISLWFPRWNCAMRSQQKGAQA